MASGYNTEPAPKLVPVLDGKKVVFSRETEKPADAEADKPAEASKTEKPKAAEKQ